MYAFKVVVSTLILLMMIVLVFSIAKSKDQGGKMTAFLMLLIEALSVIAIWG